MSVKERINEYLSSQGISGYGFEKSIGKSKGWWANCKNPTSENLSIILRIYPLLSAEWVLRGKGHMLVNDEGKALEIISDGKEAYYKELVKMKEERVNALEKELAELKSKMSL